MKTPLEFKKLIPKRKPATHKGDYGHVFIIAGSLGLTGAAALCSEAALRCGSGLVTLGIPESLNDIMEVKLTEVMTKPLPQTNARTLSTMALKEIVEFSKECDVLAIGPGLSRNPQIHHLVQEVIAAVHKPVVIDADGINALAGKLDTLLKTNAPLVLTPHPGELARLLAVNTQDIQEQRAKIAVDFAKKYQVVLVLKGYRSVVVSREGEKTYINKTGNPGMASAGVGDVLTGMIASFIGQKIAPFEAAKLAVYLHGLAGDLAAKKKGEASLIAGDIISNLSDAIKSLA
ncbi:MAG: NAD(P)H-hydrate dehydratase [Candidatus Omnitrophota bacterium]